MKYLYALGFLIGSFQTCTVAYQAGLRFVLGFLIGSFQTRLV